MKLIKDVDLELERWKMILSKEEFKDKFPYYQPELMSKSEVAVKIVNLFNPIMGGKWDSEMYQQKKDVMLLIDKIKP